MKTGKTIVRLVSAYTHTASTEEQRPDTRPGPYYVSIKDGDRFGLLAGPFKTHQEALDMVATARRIAYEVNPGQAAWAAFGTCRVKRSYRTPGILNDKMGI